MKEKFLVLGFLCLIGLGGCIFAYKNGPLQLGTKTVVPPPGWTMPSPNITPPVVIPPNIPKAMPR